MLVLQDRVDLAARSLANKLNLHPDADFTTAGKILLQKFLKAAADPPETRSVEFTSLLNQQWCGTILLDLMQKLPSLSEEALVRLEYRP